MARGKEMLQNGKQVAEDLEPYRRLIEIQKQVMNLSKKHEQTKRECDALRDLVVREVNQRRSPRVKPGKIRKIAGFILFLSLFLAFVLAFAGETRPEDWKSWVEKYPTDFIRAIIKTAR